MIYLAGKGEERFKKSWQVEWGEVEFSEFPNGEQRVRVLSQVKGRRCVVVQGMAGEPDRDWVRAMLLADALRGEGAVRVKLVCPFMAYSLMSRKFAGEPRSAEVVGRTLSLFFDEVEVWEGHDERIAKFFRVPFYNRPILWEMARAVARSDGRRVTSNLVVVAPDEGGAVRARQVADVWGVERVWVGEKKREAVSTRIKELVLRPYRGEKRLAKGVKRAVIVDDMVNTGGTVARVAELLRQRGVEEVGLMVAHWLPVAGNWEKVSKVVDWVRVSESVKLEMRSKKLKVVRVGGEFGGWNLEYRI